MDHLVQKTNDHNIIMVGVFKSNVQCDLNWNALIIVYLSLLAFMYMYLTVSHSQVNQCFALDNCTSLSLIVICAPCPGMMLSRLKMFRPIVSVTVFL